MSKFDRLKRMQAAVESHITFTTDWQSQERLSNIASELGAIADEVYFMEEALEAAKESVT